ncbi:hypothetical protein GVN18_34125 [Pseudomonas sp. ODNR1LW]|nr:hypothetical protein [Pseudomonas sp. ODNR1LW]
MTGGALAAPVGVQAPLFTGLQTLATSTTDIAAADNRVMARFELHRALDRGNDADLVVWARRWGEAMVDGVEYHVAEAERAEAALDDSDNLSSSLDYDRVKEIEDAVDSAKEAAFEARARFDNLNCPEAKAAIADLDEAIGHLQRALKELDAL